MLRSVLGKTLRDQRRSLLFWSLGFVAVTLIYVAPYRSFVEQGLLETRESAIYEAIGFDQTPAGYLRGTVFGLIGPLLLIMAATTYGARAIAGDEEDGTLDLLLAHPLSRARLVLERAGGLGAAVALLGAVLWAAVVTATRVADMGIPVARLTLAVLGLALLALTFGAVALALGAATGRRGLVVGVTAALAVASYVAFTFAPQVDALAFLEPLSPFTWYLGDNPLVGPPDALGLTLLVAVPLALCALAVAAFERRDIAV